jgi:cysteine desulfurase
MDMAAAFVFFDYNSTTPLDPEVQEAMTAAQADAWGNPSSVHAYGRAAKKLLEEARERTAVQIGCEPGELYFTSGGTESDNLALKGCYFGNPRRPRRLALSAIEHPAILGAGDDLRRAGAELISVPCDRRGVVTPEALALALEQDVLLATVMAASNETGIRQPVKELAAAAHARGALFHTDAVQALGKIPVDVRDWDVDLLALTAHKFYGPRGIGALFIRRGIACSAQISGGAHERGRRAGTENVIGAWGLALALEKANRLLAEEDRRLRALTTDFIARLIASVPGVHLHGDPDLRVANTVSLTFAGVEGEAVVVSLDLKGLCVASGSACSSGATEPSHVILAMGVEPRLAAGALRFSFGRFTTVADVERLLGELPSVVSRLRELSPSFDGGDR